jgi:hypothetical protein
MIEYSGASLQELILFDEPNIFIIENISIYCLNLIKLEINIGPNINLLVFSYFKNLKIRTLNIIYRNIDRQNYDGIEIFKSLANNLPTNVKEISLYMKELRFNFVSYGFDYDNISYVREFLESCHDCLEIITLHYSIRLEILEIILNYIKRSNSSLKILSMRNLENSVDHEGLEILDEIKAKGVKVVDFYRS